MKADQTRSRRSISRRTIRGVLWCILFVYSSICLHFYIYQEWYLLEPNAAPSGERPCSLDGEEFVLTTANDGTVHIRRYPSLESQVRGSVLYLHGNKGNMDRCEWEIEFLLQLGYEVWTMDYRGFGDSTGPMSESAMIADGEAAFARMMNHQPQAPIVVWGRSLGSGIAAAVAATAERKPDLLVLETPYWSLPDAVRQNHWYLPSVIFRYELPTHRFLESVRCPVHLIHGTRDEKITSDSSDRLYDLCERLGIRGTGHSIMCGSHNLRGRSEFELAAERILASE